MSIEKRTVVTLRDGEDADAFLAEVSSGTSTSPFVPNRQVTVDNDRPDSLYNMDLILTQAEAETLKQDPRVLDTRWGTRSDNGIEIRRSITGATVPYHRNTTWTTNADGNWGIPSCNTNANPFSGSSQLDYARPYTLDGTGVDVVIFDSGIQADHPEWLNTAGTTSRLQQVNWYTLASQVGTLPVNFYTDVNGHGTNVTSIVAGRYYGWAPGANIYIMNILGDNVNSRVSPTQGINWVRIWHENKPVDPVTGYKRPTIVNHSWGSYGVGSVFTGYNYRNGGNVTIAWSNTNSAALGNVGLLSSSGTYNTSDPIPYADTSIDSDMRAAMNSGVIMVSAAGNFGYKIDEVGGADYNNYCIRSSGFYTYYMRGASPASTVGMIRVGAIDVNSDSKAYFSSAGPGVQAFAPGSYIAGACSNTSALGGYPISTYPLNTNYKNIKVAGTSQASPQVCGQIATILQARPYLNQAKAVDVVNDNATQNRITGTSGNSTSYTNTASLLGGNNAYAYNPFHGSVVTVATENGNSSSSSTVYGTL